MSQAGRPSRLDPQIAVAFYNRGLSYRALHDKVKANADFAEASRLDPALQRP